MSAARTHKTRNILKDGIANRKPFKLSNLVGVHAKGHECGIGRMSAAGPEEVKDFLDGIEAGDIDFIVYSYHTPIAWHTSRGWVVTGHRYSASTNSQLSAVESMLSTYDYTEHSWVRPYRVAGKSYAVSDIV